MLEVIEVHKSFARFAPQTQNARTGRGFLQNPASAFCPAHESSSQEQRKGSISIWFGENCHALNNMLQQHLTGAQNKKKGRAVLESEEFKANKQKGATT
eukprot:scaffold46204_cov19-Tisochrysis_lutea.AAC.3